MRRCLWTALAAAVAITWCSGPVFAGERIVIAHRGASGRLPEHTLEAYAMAYALGADYIEPDLVRTKDGHFICLHDIHLEGTTDVETRFPARKRDDGRWYAADFTLAEVKSLRAHERLLNRFPQDAPGFQVPTFQEMLQLVQGLNNTMGRTVGVYPELKAPGWHERNGLPMEQAFLDIAAEYGYKGPDAPIYVQCFEPDTLKRLRQMGCDLPFIQLVGGSAAHDALMSVEGLRDIAAYAQGIGPDKKRIMAEPEVVRRAHAAGLKVHPYTLRKDAVPGVYADFQDELRHFYVVYGVDGLFTDFPGVAARFLEDPAAAAQD